MSLYASFEEAWWAVQRVRPEQTPWLDDDGDGFADVGEVAARRGFGSTRTLGDAWAPWVVWARVGEREKGKREKGEGLGVIEAEVRDDGRVSEVWAVVYSPSYQPPKPGMTEGLVVEDLPRVALLDVNGDGVYSAAYDGFGEGGAYRVVVYAVDGEGLVGRPRGVEVHRVYLPMVVK
jgi:hypothetical protein